MKMNEIVKHTHAVSQRITIIQLGSLLNVKHFLDRPLALAEGNNNNTVGEFIECKSLCGPSVGFG